MKIKRSHLLMGLVFLAGAAQAVATPIQTKFGAEAKAGETKFRRPEDLLDMVPFLSGIPRHFILGNGFKMKLGVDNLRIDHMGYRSSTRKDARDCMVGFSYTTPVAGFFTTRIDLPLVTSITPRVQDWTVSRLGDYTAYFSRGAAAGPSLRFVLTAKF